MPADVAASIRARLLNRSRKAGEEFELHLVRYASERFLYRLGASPHRDKFILKGAALLTLWLRDPYRATRDLDFLARGSGDRQAIRHLVEAICAVPCPEDGLRFDVASLDTSPIRADDEYQGIRVVLQAWLGQARIRLQLDFGYGDAVVPRPLQADYPTMLAELPQPRVRAYPREASVAEKVEAMVQLGRRNSRMKDFHDIWALSSAFAFDGGVLLRAIVACFERRGTAWLTTDPDALTPRFYARTDLQTRWGSYLRGSALASAPPRSFVVVGERMLGFFLPLRSAAKAGSRFAATWPAGGPWQESTH